MLNTTQLLTHTTRLQNNNSCDPLLNSGYTVLNPVKQNSMLATPCSFEHLSNIYRTSIEHLSHIYRTSIEHISRINRTHIEHLSKIYRTSIEHLSNIYRLSIEHLSKKRGGPIVHCPRLLFVGTPLCTALGFLLGFPAGGSSFSKRVN